MVGCAISICSILYNQISFFSLVVGDQLFFFVAHSVCCSFIFSCHTKNPHRIAPIQVITSSIQNSIVIL